MSQFSNYLETNIIESTLRGVAFPVPSVVYVALFTADPTDANITANEVSLTAWPAYSRQDAAQGGAVATGWTSPSNGQTSNAKVLTYGANNGPTSVTVTHVGIYDAATGGNLLYHAPLQSPKTLQVTDVLSFAIGALAVQVA